MGAASGGDPSTGWSRPRLRLRAGLATGTASAMPWQEIAGQDRAVRLLRGALERGQPHHAYLLAGPAGIGKELLARLFAQAANCEAVSGEQPCGSCAACAAIARGNHPDVMRVLPQSEAVARGLISRADLEGAPSREIRVDEVRALSRRLALVAARGRRKVAVVAPAEALNERAQNTLLKTLEEPPPSTTFLLVSEQPDALLATVRSRCARVQLAPLPEKVLVEQLIKRGAPADEARRRAARAGGSLGRALADAVQAWTRDLLVAQAGGAIDSPELSATAARLAQEIAPPALLSQASLCAEAIEALDQNGNGRLQLERLLLGIRELRRG